MTIHELAKELKLSSATVSLALKGDLRIADATRRRVIDCAGKAGYKVNEQARNLRLGRSGLVALLVHDIASDFWAGAVKSIEDALGEEYSVLICNSDGDLTKERRIVERLLARRIDGLIIQPADNAHVEHLSALNDAGIPVVLFERNDDERLSFVKGDDYGAARKAVDLFVKAGRKRVAMLSFTMKHLHYGAIDRKRGFDDAVLEHGIEASCRHIQLDSLSDELLRSGLLPAAKVFDAILCLSFTPALHRALREGGLRVPEDIATLCWDNSALSANLSPSASCIAIPICEMGSSAAGLVKAFGGGARKASSSLLDEPFVFRDSFNPEAGGLGA